ncbi:NAD(P)/FAD-dependent oxidoreductase [Algihabitans albus]|uniref:NAD(P)/FAD-dependent oxidoreductase n=1 Tax=Algihabitans albus TaxID=2164067 RepID=UPI000E5D87DC|nr:NAD(P)/FAD-dependent oxidoreductase [Algihabitans albus]
MTQNTQTINGETDGGGTGAAQSVDVAIVGAGPVGLFAVFELGMLKMRTAVIDVLEAVGGQCAALYPEKPIYDIPGYPKVMAYDLIEKLVEQAAPFDPSYHLGQQVERLERTAEGRWRLTTSKGVIIEATAVVIAAGVGAFGPNRPPLTGLEGYEASGAVQYMVPKPEAFRDKRLIIAGGGDSALDWALNLAPLARSVAVVHRRAKFRAAPDSVAKLYALAAAPDSGVELVVPYQLQGLEGDGDRLSAVAVQDLEGNERRLEADILLPFYGLSMNLGPIADWGLDLERSHILVDPENCATSVPGVFAIGDMATYPGKLKLILCGFSEAAMAAHAIYALVHPGEALHWEYSTTKGLPDEDRRDSAA